MCTAIALSSPGCFFGRNLDLERSIGEKVVFCPRAFPLALRHLPAISRHAAILGMAREEDGFPLYFDAMNEHGLAMAGLNFPDFCAYHPIDKKKPNVAPFELIPYVLGTCDSLHAARALLEQINLTDTPFSPTFPNTPLHFMLTSREGSLVIESTKDGLQTYDNPVDVMTNSPPFPWHMQRLCDFMGLSADPASLRFGGSLPLHAYSRGMGAIGLPGDLSSSSRFVRAAFARANSVCPSDSSGALQLMHLLDFVAMPRGCVRLEDEQLEYTVYTSCMDLEQKTYYYKAYEDVTPKSIRMHTEDLDLNMLLFPG